MANEINVGKLVAEIVLESETNEAEQKIAQSAQNIKDTLKDVANTNVKVDVTVDSQKAAQAAEKAQQAIENIAEKTNAEVDITVDGQSAIEETKRIEKEIQEWMDYRFGKTAVAIVPDDTNTEEMLQKIGEYLDNIGIKATDVEVVMSECFGDLSVYSQYEKQLNIIAAKLDQQRNKVSDLKKEQQYLSSENSSISQNKKLDEVTKQYEQEILKLKQLEMQFDKVVIAQDNYVNKKITNYQKGVEAAEKTALKEQQLSEQTAQKQQQINDKLAQKQNKADTNLAITELTTGLRSLNTVAPGTIDNIGSIVRNINLIKKASASGASSFVSTIAGITGVVGSIATLAINYYEGVKEEQEEARQQAAELADEYSKSSKAINDITTEYNSLRMKLDSATLSHSDELKTKEQLLRVQEQLVEKYGSEANNIDLVNGKLDDEIAKLNNLSKLEAMAYVGENKESYEKAKNELAWEWDYSIGDINVIKDEKVRKKVEEELKGVFNAKDNAIGLSVKLDYNDVQDGLIDIRQYYEELRDDGEITKDEFDSLADTLENTAKKLPKDKINDWKDIVTQYESAQNEVEESNENLADSFQSVYDEIVSELSAVKNASSAYESIISGKTLDSSTLIELCDQFPTLATYIAQTGDLSLEMGEKIKIAQKEMLQSNIATLEEQQRQLKEKKQQLEKTGQELSNDEEKNLAQVTGVLTIYKSQLEELNNAKVSTKVEINLDDFTAATQTLSNAYKTLNSKVPGVCRSSE